MPYLVLLGIGGMAFVSTDIDDLVLLIVLFSDRHLSSRQVVVGQYLGFFAVVATSVICSLLAIAISPHWVGVLGVWPLLLGARRLFHPTGGEVIGEPAKVAASSGGIPTVILLALANGGDNLTVYTALFATLTAGQTAMLVVEFLLLRVLLCALAKFLVTHPVTGRVIRRIAHMTLPYILMGLGIWILVRSLPGFAPVS